MARRAHTTELGSIACDDLKELGAGKEGWLVDNPNILCALDDNYIALANKSLILVLGSSDDSYSNPRLKIVPDLSPIEAEYITAIEWLVLENIRVLAAGTSSGYLLIFSLDGDLIHKQIVYPGKILKIRVRGLKTDFSHDISGAEVCVVMQGAIGRFDGDDILDLAD